MLNDKLIEESMVLINHGYLKDEKRIVYKIPVGKINENETKKLMKKLKKQIKF